MGFKCSSGLVPDHLNTCFLQIPELQTELDQTSLKLQATEVHLKEFGALKVQLQDRHDEAVRLKSQIQDDKLQR